MPVQSKMDQPIGEPNRVYGIPRCQAITKSGKNKGSVCGKNCKDIYLFCGYHYHIPKCSYIGKEGKEAAKDKSVDGRYHNGANERIDLKHFEQVINDPKTEYERNISEKIKQEFYEKTGKPLESIEVKGGRRLHYDMTGYFDDGCSSIKIEVKSSIKGKITENGPGWENSVQLLNDFPKNYQFMERYQLLFFEELIKSGLLELKEITFEQWKIEACRSGSPKLDCMNKLKKEEYKQKLRNIREKVIKDFEITDEEKTQMITYVEPKLKEILNDKEIFLETTGNIEKGTFKFALKYRIEPPRILGVVMRKEKDLKFDFITEEGVYNYTGSQRWGNRIGIAGLRFDIK